MYMCSAENKVGKDERLIYFYVTSEYTYTQSLVFVSFAQLPWGVHI